MKTLAKLCPWSSNSSTRRSPRGAESNTWYLSLGEVSEIRKNCGYCRRLWLQPPRTVLRTPTRSCCMEGGEKMSCCGMGGACDYKNHCKARNSLCALPWAALMAWNKWLALSELPTSKTQMALPQRGLWGLIHSYLWSASVFSGYKLPQKQNISQRTDSVATCSLWTVDGQDAPYQWV